MNLPLPNPELATSFGRRAFLRRSGLAAFTAALAPMALSPIFNPARAQAADPFTDADILNFALNLEYLEGEYYSKAAFGVGLADQPGVDLTGVGTQGTTTAPTGAGGGGGVAFSSNVIRDYAVEIAIDEISHIKFLRRTLGTAAIAKPTIDLAGAFNAAAQAAGINDTFNPYSSDGAFLLGAITLTDVGVTAYHGAAAFITDKNVLAAAGGLLGAESYHDATLRTSLYAINFDDPTQFYGVAANKVSQLRDSLDGPLDLDQGITTPTGGSNIVPTNGSSIVFSRLPGQVLNIVYSKLGATSGGFFPNGVNGNITAGMRFNG